MYISMLNIKKDRNKLLWFIILGAITIAVMLISVTIYKLLNDENVNLNLNIDSKVNVFETSYYKYGANIKIYGNKTINNYYIEEEYEDVNGNYKFKFDTKNDNNNMVTYKIENNTLKISSEGQINEYVLGEYIVKKTNVLSISTFISLYNDVEKYLKENPDSQEIKIEVDNRENITSYKVIVNNKENTILSSYKDIFESGMNITKFELCISSDTKLPTEYRVYDKEDKTYLDVQYTFFSL